MVLTTIIPIDTISLRVHKVYHQYPHIYLGVFITTYHLQSATILRASQSTPTWLLKFHTYHIPLNTHLYPMTSHDRCAYNTCSFHTDCVTKLMLFHIDSALSAYCPSTHISKSPSVFMGQTHNITMLSLSLNIHKTSHSSSYTFIFLSQISQLVVPINQKSDFLVSLKSKPSPWIFYSFPISLSLHTALTKIITYWSFPLVHILNKRATKNKSNCHLILEINWLYLFLVYHNRAPNRSIWVNFECDIVE